MLEWVRSSQRGDLIRRGTEMVALRGGKLLRLDAPSWPAADAVSEATLRRLMDASGSERIDLAGDGRDWSDGGRGRATFLVLLSAEGDFWTVAVESVNAAGDFRIRQRMHPVSYDAKSHPQVRPADTDNSGTLATVAGRILDQDGKPIKTRGELYYDSRFHRGRLSGPAAGCTTDSFWAQVPAGEVSLGYFCKGYKPSWLNFDITPGGKLEDITFRLQAGRPGTVRVVDENNRPIAGAVVIQQPQYMGIPLGHESTLVTNNQGECTVHDAGGGARVLKVYAAGYFQHQKGSGNFYAFHKDDVATVTMTRPRTARGVVRDAEGNLLQGAKLYIRDCCFDAPLGKLVATTDANGNFVIQELLPEARPLILVQAPNGAVGIYRGLRVRQEHSIVVPKLAELRVDIKGELLPADKASDGQRFEVRQHIFSRPEDRESFFNADYGFILLDKPKIEPTADGGVAVFRGLAVECDPKSEQHSVEVFVSNGDRWGSSKQAIVRDGVTQVEISLRAADAKNE